MNHSCEFCGDAYEKKPGRGSHNRVSCYTCTDGSGKARLRSYRNKHLKRQYGITLADFSRMYERQQGRCAICSAEVTFDGANLKAKDVRAGNEPCVDHCHTTGKVRGILCFHCNTALGHVFDDQTILARMSEYLR